MRIRLPSLLLLLLIFLLTGCSSSKPITPNFQSFNDEINSLPLICLEVNSNNFNAIGLLGAFDLTIDSNGPTAELTPKRTPSLGQSYLLNAISYYVITPCATCLKLKSLSYDYPYIRATFTISHPFEKGNPSEPPSAINRLDLDVFDVAMIVLPIDDEPNEARLIGSSIYSDSCAFADGYTRELTEVIGETFACPYYLAIDDTDTGISTFNRFEMGTKDREFDAWFTDGFFELYLTMGYGISATLINRLDPIYYNPEFNRKNAWKVNVIPPAEGWPPSDNSETRDVVIEVYDWQIDAVVDPNLDDPSDIYAASNVLGVGVEIVDMTPSLKIVTTPTGAHTGRPDDPLIYTVPIANENFLPGGYYLGIVKVLDERVPPQNPFYGQTDALVDIPDGVNLNFVSMPEFATYQVFTAEVWSNDPPIADLDVSDYFIDSGMSIQMWPGPATEDPDGDIILYEYDFNYLNGIFYPEASNTDGSPVTSPPFYNPEFGQITRQVAMRVTDNGIPQKSAVSVVTINILPLSHEYWTLTWGGEGSDKCLDMEIDSMGNIYTCGEFYDVVDFDPGSGEEYHTATYNDECYLSKIDSNGDFVWALNWGGTGLESDRAQGLSIDSEDNVYVTGCFCDSVDFDPGPDEEVKTSNGDTDVFFVKFSSISEFQWVYTWGGEYWDFGFSICTDSNDNLYISGLFRGVVDFDPTDEIDIHTSNMNHYDAFLCKYDHNGNYLWTRTFTEPPVSYEGFFCVGVHSEIDSLDNIYLTGSFCKEIDFDPDPLSEVWHTSNGHYDIFLVKFNPDGKYIWSKTWGTSDYFNDRGKHLTTHNADYVCIVGYVGGDLDLDPGPDEDLKTAFEYKDIFISKFSTDGDYIWGHILGGEGDDLSTDVLVTPEEDIYIVGYFEENADFNPGNEIDNRISNGWFDIFVCKFESDGHYSGTITIGGVATDIVNCIELAENGDFFLAGNFGDTVDFDPTSYGTDNHTSNGSLDVFLTRF